MILDVFLCFKKCPKHPSTPTFFFVPRIAYFGNPLHSRHGEIGNDRYEIKLRFEGAKGD